MKNSGKILVILTALVCLLPAVVLAQSCNANMQASTPTGNFTDNNDGTVTDNTTGLMWKKCSEGQTGADCSGGAAVAYTWQGALQQAQAVRTAGFAGHNDWRVPNIKELESIVERKCVSPCINSEVFPNTPADWFWSSSPYAADGANAWLIFFDHGDGYLFLKNDNYYVRLVRGGQ